MKVTLHPQAKERLAERGATKTEVIATVMEGEQFQAKFGRIGFRRNFNVSKAMAWACIATKQIMAFADRDADG